MVVPIFRREEYLISFYINIIFYQKIIKNFADWTFKLFFKPNKLIECIVSFVPKLSNSITLLIIYINFRNENSLFKTSNYKKIIILIQ